MLCTMPHSGLGCRDEVNEGGELLTRLLVGQQMIHDAFKGDVCQFKVLSDVFELGVIVCRTRMNSQLLPKTAVAPRWPRSAAELEGPDQNPVTVIPTSVSRF